mmetsp:Transcript_45165/g.83579  ORF Transcript_45165/g.83579 Transcript_45165/m.83579 type:complete len:332 (-) Transcript_45165:101-1096(-)|eukprot:CAMPEP_0197468804 /NCGR_PEP_ID=MMETSP1175-20131217/66271_1 /TAXON_ID=1003142 /ORGANISM="Triceratium dubium, Strain CCMP147" /LENGTH=331 /DNA_ID=CAMNT_0043004923 /DNA_START=41 /DNA_END=1036 /DNA_ORIENTATION=+
MKIISKAIIASLSAGYASAACTNSATFGSLDQGCAADKPICIDSSTGEEVGYRAAGDDCAACLRVYNEAHYNGGLSDFGCSSNKPRCMSNQGSDPPSYNAGSQCCDADGTCSPVAPVTCPCNLPGSWINNFVNGDTQLTSLPSDDGFCYYDDSAKSNTVLYNTEGSGRVFFAKDYLSDSNQWHCESTGTGVLAISEAEAQACATDLKNGLISNGIDTAAECFPTTPPTCPCNVPGTWFNDFVKGDKNVTDIPGSNGQCYSVDSSGFCVMLSDGSACVVNNEDIDQWTCDSYQTFDWPGLSITEVEAQACISDLQNSLQSQGVDIASQCQEY